MTHDEATEDVLAQIGADLQNSDTPEGKFAEVSLGLLFELAYAPEQPRIEQRKRSWP